MKMARIRFLEQGEAVRLPKGGRFLPKGLQKRAAAYCKPYCLTAERGILTGILQTDAETGMTADWRKNAEKLMRLLQKEEVVILLPPPAGELPRGILPFATGKRLLCLFAFVGAAEALRRQGKEPAQCRYLLAGGDAAAWRAALTSMGNEGNHLSIFTANPNAAGALVQELFAERGLMTEVFSSPKNPAFLQADVVFCCGMEQCAYEYMLQKGAIWIDLAGNHPALRRLLERRQDVIALDGFFFRKAEQQMNGQTTEADAFLSCGIFRENWQFPLVEAARSEMFSALREMGYDVSGFSAEGKRVKIQRKP